MKFESVQEELALDRRQSAAKDERIVALEKDNARMLTQLEILQVGSQARTEAAPSWY